jgi:hypothetical protein
MISKNSVFVIIILVLIVLIIGTFLIIRQNSNSTLQYRRATSAYTTITSLTTNSTSTIYTTIIPNNYTFQTVIGSVINGAVPKGRFQYTKALQLRDSYSYPELFNIGLIQNVSPYTAAGDVPFANYICQNPWTHCGSAYYSGTGVTFSSFGISYGGPPLYDNIMQINSSQFPILLNNYGKYGETEYIWLTGTPVFDQGYYGSWTNKFIDNNAGGVYQIIFNKPILNKINSINYPISFLGSNYIITNAIGAGINKVKENMTVAGGRIILKSTSSITTINLTNGRSFSNTSNPGWFVTLLWTNLTSNSVNGTADYLQSIILYNTTPTLLFQGQSFNFLQSNYNFAKLTFIGEQQNSSNFDNISVVPTTSYLLFGGAITYQNLGYRNNTPNVPHITNITSPAQILTVSSQISNSFIYANQTSNVLHYALVPYQLNEFGSVNQNYNNNNISIVKLSYHDPNGANWITPSNQLIVLITGYPTTTSGPLRENAIFTSNSQTITLGESLHNVTGIELERYNLLPNIIINVSTIITRTNRTVNLASLTNTTSPALLYPGGFSYYSLSESAASNILYNQYNGQPASKFILSKSRLPTNIGVGQYFTYNLSEYNVPSNNLAKDGFIIGIDNSTRGLMVNASPIFQVNYSIPYSNYSEGVPNNITYYSTSRINTFYQDTFPITRNERSEKGSNDSEINSSIDVIKMAKNFVKLDFKVT